jgi:hypothetical protein
LWGEQAAPSKIGHCRDATTTLYIIANNFLGSQRPDYRIAPSFRVDGAAVERVEIHRKLLEGRAKIRLLGRSGVFFNSSASS